MGRSYRDELAELSATQARLPADIPRKLAEQAAEASDAGLIVVASGGAKVVAEWASRLQRMSFGCAAVAMTPLEYAALPVPVKASTWLISAGGKHPDILQAARAAASRGDACVVGLIGQSKTPLEEFLASELRSTTISFDMAPGRDGFLATNSVWAMVCALAKAHARWLPAEGLLDDAHCDRLLAWGKTQAQSASETQTGELDLVVLHDAWTALGAQDFETRVTEAALTNLWVSDLRNFGHGRHFWIADRPDRTLLVALTSPASNAMTSATLDVLPPGLPTLRVHTPDDGIAGALASLAWSIHATARWAERRGRDPGRPGVPRFGEMLYEGGFPYPAAVAADPTRRALLRKSTPASVTDERGDWHEAYQAARSRLRGVAICAVVMDYDGTLVDSPKRYKPLDTQLATELRRLLDLGVTLGVATGRGDSIQKELRAALPDTKHWSRVIVGYHNGARTLGLDEVAPDLDGDPSHPRLRRACDALRQHVETNALGTLRCREHQLTVTPVAGQSLVQAWRATRECLDSHGLEDIRVWLSSHSVDILSPDCSKLHVVSRVASVARCSPEAVLRIGDRGAWPGNDWELLAAPLGVSVDESSCDPSTGWNLLPPTLKGAAATLHLLRRLHAGESGKVRFIDEVCDA